MDNLIFKTALNHIIDIQKCLDELEYKKQQSILNIFQQNYEIYSKKFGRVYFDRIDFKNKKLICCAFNGREFAWDFNFCYDGEEDLNFKEKNIKE